MYRPEEGIRLGVSEAATCQVRRVIITEGSGYVDGQFQRGGQQGRLYAGEVALVELRIHTGAQR